jgi:3-dehydroquinate dehydratase/shikimate dehydrogenase
MTAPPICATVTGRTTEEIRRRREAAANADLVELRLDGVEAPDVAAALADRTRPVIVTCRPAWEGGRFTGSEEARRDILCTALDLGAEFVDVEFAAPFAAELLQRRHGRGIVLSSHLTGASGDALLQRYEAMRATQAEVLKLAALVDTLTELLTFFDLARLDDQPGRGHVLIAMGIPGIPSRVLSARLGNHWTYAGDGVAAGQLPVDRLLREFRFRRVRSDAALYGVVGNPIAHSLSPAMHNAGFAALGLNAVYVPLQAAAAADFVRFARGSGLVGASITSPFKVALMAAMDEVEPLARRVGAVNTLAVRDGRWIGANTDVAGFLAPLAGRINLRGVRATVLGAGGAARAVAIALADEGAAVTICARRPDRAQALAEATGARVGPFPPPSGSWDVLVNTTPAGSPTMPVNPIAGQPLDGEIVFDLVYAPASTPLLAAAQEYGCLTIGGLEMLVAQAERQFEIWTGQRPPRELFLSNAVEALASARESTAAASGL